MPKLSIDLGQVSADAVEQIRYAMAFVSDDVARYEIEDGSRLVVELKADADESEVRARIDQIIIRYTQTEFGMKTVVDFEQKLDLPQIDAWSGLVERKWATPVGDGHVVLRGPAALLMAVLEDRIDRTFIREFQAEMEHFPSTIRAETLHRCNHFTSFPEHMDFVAHLKEDLQVLKNFSDACRNNGWSPALHDGTMSLSDFAISPSCCYHAYEAMEGWSLEKPGRCLTAVLHCHRYEGANHRFMSRLRAFTMREVVWVGQAPWIISNRAKAEQLILDWARDWELSCTFETANDMFFTDDYAVKASFQRQQQGKKELRLDIPSEQRSISVFSSNFHSTTFGRAFGITVGGRPATSGCVAWGCERWVYAIFSQFGFEPKLWPAGLRADYERVAANRPVLAASAGLA